MSPDLLPDRAPSVRARLRFYDLEFEAVSAETPLLAVRQGRFREGVVAFAARGAGLDGEVSAFLWSDSTTYLMWGREAFGWPISIGELNLEGALWDNPSLDGVSGRARLVDERWGSADLVVTAIKAASAQGAPNGHWLTPRRVLHGAGCDGETRELLVVRPLVIDAGTSYIASGSVQFNFRSPHPLHLMGKVSADVEIAVAFELKVGADVTVEKSEVLQSVRRRDSEGP